MTQPPPHSSPEPVAPDRVNLIQETQSASTRKSRQWLMIPLILIAAILLFIGGWLLLNGDLSSLTGSSAKASQSAQPLPGNHASQNQANSTSPDSSPASSDADQQEEFMLVNNVKIQMGMSQRYLESKLGIPQESYKNRQIWQLANGSRFAASFDDHGLSDATLSGKNPADYFSYYGVKVTPGRDSIASIERKIEGGCYHFGWFMQYALAEYVVRGGPEGSWLINFTTTGASGDDEVTDAQLKNQKILSVSFGYHDSEPSVEEKYCTGDAAGVASSITPAPATDAPTAGQYNLPAYEGNPRTDNRFNQFIQKHINETVKLKLNIPDEAVQLNITDGFLGGGPGFYPLQNKQFNYMVFIECEGAGKLDSENTIAQCGSLIQWNEKTGQLSGKFKVKFEGEDQPYSVVELTAIP